jgi:hypothetical protein
MGKIVGIPNGGQEGQVGQKQPEKEQQTATYGGSDIAHLIVLDCLLNGFYGDSVDFRSQIRELGWVGLEPTTNALKGRCSTIELPTREEMSSESITKSLRCN